MKRVFQSRIEKKHGTCMQATMASLFEVFIDDMPNFIELKETENKNWFHVMSEIYESKGYELCCYNPRGEIEKTKKILEIDGGVNGFWAATVESIFLGPEITHSVIIDKNMNVVHDPNPNNFGHVYKPEDIIAIDVVSNKWHIDVKGNIVITETNGK